LREYSVPFDLRRMDPAMWVTGLKNAWQVCEALDELRHFPLLNGRHVKAVTRATSSSARPAACFSTGDRARW